LRALRHQIRQLQPNQIEVLARIRPSTPSSLTTTANSISLNGETFSFSHIFPPSASQESVFERVRPSVSHVMEGYDSILFAYGPTGCGKTYTMQGTKEMPGLVWRVGDMLFGEEREGWEQLEISLFEFYNVIF